MLMFKAYACHITPVEITKVSAKFVFWGTKNREAIQSHWHKYCETFEEAREWIIQDLDKDDAELTRGLERNAQLRKHVLSLKENHEVFKMPAPGELKL